MSKIPPIGNRAQLGALVNAMEDALGNKDGIHDNEALAKGSLAESGFTDRQPALSMVKTVLATGISGKDEAEKLTQFLAAQEARWREPVTRLEAGKVADYDRFKVEKAIALTRFNRRPDEVVDGIVAARGSVDGQKIADRDVFVQHWKPIGEPTGKVVVVSPGFLQTGRHFYEQIDLLNKQGHDVVVMDHQWAGYGSGPKGGIDRGFGIARDVAAVAARAQAIADETYPNKPHEVVLLGTSMGAGAGVLGALTMNDAGKIKLEGAQMPKGLNAVLQAPYFGKADTAVNKVLSFLGKIPLVKHLPLPSIGLPILAADQDINTKLAQHGNAQGVVARAEAIHASDADIRRMRELLQAGTRPDGKVYFLHGRKDPLADPATAREFAGLLGDKAKFHEAQTGNHVMEEGKEQALMLQGLAWLAQK